MRRWTHTATLVLLVFATFLMGVLTVEAIVHAPREPDPGVLTPARIVLIEEPSGPDRPHFTILEFETGERVRLPGIYGDVGDEFLGRAAE